MKLNIAELDCFFMSYDEPNAELNWAHLNTTAHWAQRIHGLHGFDTAHKACAMASNTDYLVTIDGDNTVFPEFFELELEVPKKMENCVLSWNSINSINGLQYGNGGVKIWPKEFLLNMQSHENAVNTTQSVDFCWDANYIQLAKVFSTTHPNGSPYQAFRSGFREGCKMTLARGEQVDTHIVASAIDPMTIIRLQTWGSVGRDVPNGIWAILGTRLGVHYTNVQKRDITIVRDYQNFKEEIADEWLRLPDEGVEVMLTKLKREVFDTTGIEFFDFTTEQSAFVKKLHSSLGVISDPMLSETEMLACLM